MPTLTKPRHNNDALLTASLAKTAAEIDACKALMSHVYLTKYGVTLSDTESDPGQKIEGFPHRFILGRIGNETIATIGLYTHDTYVERYGNIDLRASIAFPHYGFQEVARFAISDNWASSSVVKYISQAAHSAAFINTNNIVLCCGKPSVFAYYHRICGIRTHLLGNFPRLKSHEGYLKPRDAFEARYIIPCMDIPANIMKLSLPLSVKISNPTWPCGSKAII